MLQKKRNGLIFGNGGKRILIKSKSKTADIGKRKPLKQKGGKKMQTSEKIGLSVTEAAALIGISKSSMYQIIKRQDCPFAAMIGGRRLISRRRLQEWFDAQTGSGREV